MVFGSGARGNFQRATAKAKSKSKAAGGGARSTLLRQRFPRGGVVAGAALHFVALFGLHFQVEVAAVEHRVRRSVAEVVLAAQFGGNLIERFFQFVEFVTHVDDAASGSLGEFSHFALARVAAHSERSVKATIGAKQHVDDGIGSLS